MSLEVHMSEPDDFNCVELHSSITEVAHAKGIHDFQYDVDCISGKRANYIANVFRVDIKDTDSAKNTIRVIVKTLVNTERQVLFHKLHEREVLAYRHVIYNFKVLQNVLYEHERLVLSDCLFSNTEKSNEIIILEDLKTAGFEIDRKLSKFQYLEFEQITAVLSELAKFHALSFIFESQDPEKFGEVKLLFEDLLYQNHFLNKSKLRDYFFESFEMSLNQVTDLEAKKKLEKIQQKLLEMMQIYTKPSKTNVLCHGDCWVNNMLFKYEADLRTKVCFIDFQAMRYANPVTDIMYFLFICTDSVFRLNHIEELKIVYYDSLKVFLKKFNIDVESVYTRQTFTNDMEEFLPYGLLTALIELRIVTTAHDEDTMAQGFKSHSCLNLHEVTEDLELFKLRVNDVVNEAVGNGVLDRLIEEINM